ncbi:D-alanyl-D-alanine carboxypeptidase family protein, partial [Candidatus Saccharibacteria bacterium]|nr:D-alanyl-D-alanine carboxypeptidase family protein [Candidatus Saccharibacteria bacterium]
TEIGSFPSAHEMGAMTDTEVQAVGKQIGEGLAGRGVNVALAPVVDLSSDVSGEFGNSSVSRTFSIDPVVVARKAAAFASGLREAGVSPTFKHFPGLSKGKNTDNESSTIAFSEMTDDLKPYETLLGKSNKDIVMLNSSTITGLTENGLVADVSPAVVDLLRTTYKHQGLIVSDALEGPGVKNVVGGLAESAPKALAAGVAPLFGYSANGGEQGIIDAIEAVKNSGVDYNLVLNDMIKYKGGNLNAVNGGGLPSGSKVFVLGDSITVQLISPTVISDGKEVTSSFGQPLKGDLEGAGMTVSGFSAVGGQAINWGTDQVNINASTIAQSDAIIVGLGTNNLHQVLAPGAPPGRILSNAETTIKNSVQNLIDAVKEANPDINIYWTAVYSHGDSLYGSPWDLDQFYKVIDGYLREVAAANGVNVIPWDQSPDALSSLGEGGGDGIHPNGNGTKMLSKFIVNHITSNGNSDTSTTARSTGNCVCSVGGGSTETLAEDERYKIAWDFLVTDKGLSPEAAAGVMGNLKAESGIDPHNMQNNAPLPDSPYMPTDPSDPSQAHPDIRNKFGYGIAQWTSEGRQSNLIAFANNDTQGRTTGDLRLQLEFLWQELTVSYAGVLAVLQTPGVTIDDSSYTMLTEFMVPGVFVEGSDAYSVDGQTEETARRLGFSQDIYNTYSGMAPGSYASSGSQRGCGGSYAGSIDPDMEDSTGVPCASGTKDLGVDTGYRKGKEFQIRTCDIGGNLVVNSQISEGAYALFNDMLAQGLDISATGAGGGFRSMDGQVSVYERHCADAGIEPTPGPYPLASSSEYVDCPGAAPPGYSNHQMGFALDIECNGRLIEQLYTSAVDNPCFQWLQANASRYGYFEFGKGKQESRDDLDHYEGWHWSIDGK